VLFEETRRTLFCSALFFYTGDVQPLTESDIVSRARASLLELENGPLAGSVPYTPQTAGIMTRLGSLKPHSLATMHGSSCVGDGQQASKDMAVALKEMFGNHASAAGTA
jgi:hypothetical protein